MRRSGFLFLLLLFLFASCRRGADYYISRLQTLVSPEQIAADMELFAAKPHRAGSKENTAVGDALIEALRKAGGHVWTTSYAANLPEPVEAKLSLTFPSQKAISFSEKSFEQDPYSAEANHQLPFFAYVPNGDVEAEVIYANFGDRQDYAWLKKNGITVAGKIALVRAQGICRSMKQQIAEEEGLAGLLLYPDPRDQGVFKVAYPLGPGTNPWVVQRGSMLKFFQYPGDPERNNPDRKEHTLPTVPSLPISSSAAEEIFDNLQGVANPDWRAGLGREYHSGPGPARLKLTLQQIRIPKTIRNIFATLGGEDPEEPVLLISSHYDAWVYGASDPGSGTTTVLESAKALFALEKQGWKPKRDIVFAFWDAEEYGMLGSTQWVLHQLPDLRRRIAAVTYTDSVRGPLFGANISPGLRGTLDEVLARYHDPSTDKTVLEFHLEHGMPGYSDDTIPLSNLAGIPVAQLNYGLHYSMYHSVYDNLNWMKLYCDPGYRYIANLSRMLALYAILLTKDYIVPFRFSEFGEHYRKVFSKMEPQKNYAALTSLSASLAQTGKHIEEFDFSKLPVEKRRQVNARLMAAIVSFTEEPNKSSQPFVLRNAASGPDPANECGGVEVSGIQRALLASNQEMVTTELNRASQAFKRSLDMLKEAEAQLEQGK